ncbi:hypothetical protein [Larkinella harenae]
MNPIVFFLLVLVTFGACKKDNTNPGPNETADAASNVAGTYKLSSFHFIMGANEIELPTLPMMESGKTVASGTVKITRKSADKASLNVSLYLEGEGNHSLVEGLDIEIKESGSNFGLYADGDRIGDADGDFIIFNVSGTDPDSGDELKLAFNGKK